MRSSYNELLLRLGCYLSLAISFMPAVDYYCPWYITFIPVAITLLLTLRINSNIYPVFVVTIAILCFWLLTYWIIYRHRSLSNNFVNSFIAFIPCIISVQLNRTVRNTELFRGCLKMIAVFTGITCVTTIVGLNKYPSASRELASGTAIYDTLRYSKVNIGGYEFIYALVPLIPVLFWMIQNTKGFWKIVYLCVLGLDILCIYKSQYTIALVCVVVALIVVWMQNNRRAASIFTAALLVFLWLNGLQVLGKLFYWASDVVASDYVSDRLLQVAQLVSGQTVHTETSRQRLEYYAQQWEAFLSSPIWGHNWFEFYRKYASGHSLVLDILGGAGILGGSLLFILVKKIYGMVVNPKKEKQSPYVKATWIMVIVIAILNPVSYSVVITIAFMSCMCIHKIENSALTDLAKE